MVTNSDLEKWQTATNGINELGQKDLTGEEWSALVTLNGSMQNGNFESDESRRAFALLKNDLGRHSNNQILQAHLQNFIGLCEQYSPNKSETAQPQVPPPPPFKMNSQSQPATYGGIPSEDIPNWQKAIQGIEAGQNNLSSEELSAINSLKRLADSGNFGSSEGGGSIQILKDALPRHSAHRLLQVHLKNFVALCEKHFQTNRQDIPPIKNISGQPAKTAAKGGNNKTLFFIIAALVAAFFAYTHWDTVRGIIPGTNTTQANNIASNDTINLEASKQNQNSSNVLAPITSVITPWMRFTNTFTFAIEDGGYYVISYTDGNLYYRGNNKDTLILKSVKEIYELMYTSLKYSYFAIKNDNSLWAWGDNSIGQLGDNTGINKTAPVKILENVKDVILYSNSIYAIKNDGTMYVWGGVGDSEKEYAPVKLPIENVCYIDESQSKAITLSGDEYFLYGEHDLRGNHDYNVYIYGNNYPYTEVKYKLTPKGELYGDNDNLLASNIAFMGGSNTYSYITKKGELYSWGANPIGDGSNIPRKEPVLVLQNVIQSIPNIHYVLCVDGKLYSVDTKNTFKYEAIASNVYLLNGNNYYTKDGSLYTFGFDASGNFSPTLLLKDVALPKIKYVIKPPEEQNSAIQQANINDKTVGNAVDNNQVQRNTTPQSNSNINSGVSNLSSALSTRLLTEDDLRGMSKVELRILRNEIYARHGYIFKSQDLRNYFSAKDWYSPQYNDVSNLLNTIEKKNVAFIQRYE